jgi:hypothetical protein
MNYAKKSNFDPQFWIDHHFWLMGNFPQKKKVFCAYLIRINKQNNFVQETFSIRALFRQENSIWKFNK